MISFIIKAFNEEDSIGACIEAVLREASDIEHEIIVVDSLSTDRTLDIAKQYPVRIVQFLDEADRSCGAAAQLGYQTSNGDMIYLIDGDMELYPGFFAEAAVYMKDNADVAGVGGLV